MSLIGQARRSHTTPQGKNNDERYFTEGKYCHRIGWRSVLQETVLQPASPPAGHPSTRTVLHQDIPPPGQSSTRTVLHQDGPPPGQSSSRAVLQQGSPPAGRSSTRTVLQQGSPPAGQSSTRTVLHQDSPPPGQSSRVPTWLEGRRIDSSSATALQLDNPPVLL